MLKPLPLLIVAGLLSGCASEPEAGEVDRAPDVLKVSCYQAHWQAETVPILYKRGGDTALDKYEFMPNVGPVACR
ncbi:hypothetical protein [Pseudomonas sp. DSP3-2-2]|uniref:hypothetical protein n=1 Tax=unclassified Pseudomonas TaxID=196821 RepID=UPI003CEBA1CF